MRVGAMHDDVMGVAMPKVLSSTCQVNSAELWKHRPDAQVGQPPTSDEAQPGTDEESASGSGGAGD